MENLHYEDRLKHLGLTCLDRRGSRSDLIEIFKIISGMYDIRQELFFTQFGEDQRTQLRVIVVTDPQTHKHRHKHTPPARPPATDRTDNNTLRR